MKYFQAIKPKSEKGANKKNRKLKQLKHIVIHLSKSECALSIPEIAEHVRISVPTGTKLVKKLVDEGLIFEEGKKVTENGRQPVVYTIDKSKFYAVGVEILSKWIHVSIVRIDLETVHEVANRKFILEDSEECLDYIIDLIKETISDSKTDIENIIGVGIGLTGSVNGHTGESADYFKKMDSSLKEHMEDALGLPVMIDNDTRVIGIAEQVLGLAKGVENVLVIKVSRNLGLSIIVERQLIFGANGFAGNFGHIQYGTKGRLCTCGKKNCLRTEVSGNALFQDLKEALEAGEKSIYFRLEEIESYRYHDILDAVLKGDALSIKLLMHQGDILGQAIGSVVNLLNPNMVVIGGEIVMVKEFILDAIKSGMRKTGLVNSLKACKLEASELGRYFSSRGAACMVLKNYELINY